MPLTRARFVGFLLLVATAPAAAQVTAPELQPDMPITIDAESTEFDYDSNSLLFRGLRLDQGNLGIRADLAETAKLDFDDGTWNFSGNVTVEADGTRLYCDAAELRFVNHQLQSAVLTGMPARFEQSVAGADNVNSGEAETISYLLADGRLQLDGKARFSDGVNAISGQLITYDLTAQRLTAGSGESGPVTILIDPGTRLPDSDSEPGTAPGLPNDGGTSPE
ncbi:MAG: lipopolysaccharide transport periplasmic protein LptA [Gammaproteobacteria bacterium]|jgi:lipopolysaccharide transport protein LptA|nr:lipopolysaccharide transport periplasmic protein LptA [Gammaproteobacteria bacterium]